MSNACTITLADLGAGFEAVTEAQLALWQPVAESEVAAANPCAAAGEPCGLVLLLVRHYLTINVPGLGEQANKASETVGSLSVSYATTSAGTKAHGSTAWGQAYDNALAACRGRRRSAVPLGVRGVANL